MQWARLRRYRPQFIFAGIFAIIAAAFTILSFAASANSSVDFTQSITTLSDKPFSNTISTYGQGNQWITTSSKHSSDLGHLKAGYYRIPLGWQNGIVVSSARGNHSPTTGDAWISAIKAYGGTPEIVIGGNNTIPNSDVSFSPDDAANMVRHFNKPTAGAANPVHLWVIGNEPDVSQMSIQTYCSLFNASAVKMKAVDPTIQVVGPAWAFFNAPTLTTFLQCAGNNLDVLDWHHYAQGSSFLSNAVAMAQTGNWENEVNQARQLIRQIVPARASQIQIQVGEYNWSWRTNNGYPGWNGGDDRFYQAIDTAWVTSVAAHVARAGARSDYYADLGGAGGLAISDQTAAAHFGRQVLDPMPSYYGLEMLTGGNLFRGFGSTMVSANTSLNNVEIYASSNGKNIVMINKDGAAIQSASISLKGFGGGSVDVWQTDPNAPFNPPTRKATLVSVTNIVGYSLPPYSVTTFVMNDGSTTPPPPPTPTYSCDSLTASQQANTLTYSFAAHATAQNGASIVGYAYNFGDGSTLATQSAAAQHTYKPGVYTASVSVQFNVNGQTIPVTSPACSLSVSSNQPPIPVPTKLTAPARINAGGKQYTDPTGNVWQADTDFIGGITDSQNHTITGTTVAPLYQDERTGIFSYHLPIANGTYTLRLHFAEISVACQKAGCRVFDVNVNNAPWLTNLDIAAKVGPNAAYMVEKTVSASNNAIDLSFKGITGVPQLAALEILPSTVPVHGPGMEITGIKDKCLDNWHDKMVNGNKIQLYGCNSTNAQRWTMQSNGTITNANGYCLDVKNGSVKSGTNVQLYQCNNAASQIWKVKSNGTIVNVHSNLCLDDKHSRTNDGNQIWVYSCNGTSAQKWIVHQ